MSIVPNIIAKFFVKDGELYKSLQAMLGFTPGNVELYEMALCHCSANPEVDKNNERLEFLGDAILGAIVGEYLFLKYPTKPEGYLTDMRSKIVNRKKLNEIASKIGLKELMEFNEKDYFLRNSHIFGNALEALIGAIYLDKKYNKTKTFVHQRILLPFVDMDSLESQEANIKNKLISWANKENRTIDFVDIDTKSDKGRKFFEVGIILDGELMVTASAYNKKEAGKMAAQQAIEMLHID